VILSFCLGSVKVSILGVEWVAGFYRIACLDGDSSFVYLTDGSDSGTRARKRWSGGRKRHAAAPQRCLRTGA
jgi:hypothetical protein